VSVAGPARTVIDLESNSEALALAGEHDAHLKVLEERLSCRLTLRGNVLTLEGEGDACVKARAAIEELLTVIKSGRPLSPAIVESLMDIAVNAAGKPSEVYGDVVWTHRGRQIGPRTVNQKLYVDAMRRNTITFAIGPAGTGKTYLATAMAVSAFFAKTVGRIILTRPAVEAGESLGFLPGRSTRTSGRSSTLSTTCSTARSSRRCRRRARSRSRRSRSCVGAR
jgi:phosphate starvation-inducible PhoH-like protein